MELVSLGRQSVQDKENSDLKPTGPPGWGLDIGLTSLFQKKKNILRKRQQKKSTLVGVMDFQSHRKISRKENNDRKMEVLSTKTQTRIGFWNVRTMYETGKLAQVTAEMRNYNLHILGISESRWTGSGRYRTNTGETVLYSGRDDDQHHEVVAVILRKGMETA